MVSVGLMMGGTSVALLVATSSGAQAASTRDARPPAVALDASSVCAKVSPKAVSAIVGHPVPKPATTTGTIQSSPASFGVSAKVTLCRYGAEKSVADISKVVELEFEITSKPYTVSQERHLLLAAASATLKIKVVPYGGLGFPAFYFTDSDGGVSAEGITGVDGTRLFGATVNDQISQSKLAALVVLAEKL